MDKQKADRIITEYLSKIYGFALKRAYHYDEAEELCAQITAELYCSLLKSDEIYNVSGYVWRISEHVYSRYVSRVKKHQGISLEGLDIPTEDVYELGDTDEKLQILRREIAYLTKTRREIVYSYYYENKTIVAIASRHGMPVGTVKWHLSKAKRELKEGFKMERMIGKLGLNPVKAVDFGHNGDPGADSAPEYYLGDSLCLNIVYSVYHAPKTKAEIAQELGVTPVFIEDKIAMLESNGFLVRKSGGRFTTYVCFRPRTFSLEKDETVLKRQLEAAMMLAEYYVPSVRKATSGISDIYIPGGNRELLEAAAVFYSVVNKCSIDIGRKWDSEPYLIRTTGGGKYIAYVELETVQADKDYVPTLELPPMWACGSMNRWSEKYPVCSWSIDSRLSSRQGMWSNNLTSDYEYLYEYMTGMIKDDSANAEKFKRLRDRRFITDDGKVNIMVVKGGSEDFFSKLPDPDESLKRKYADFALENARIATNDYPPQMRELVFADNVVGFISNTVALMVADILYGNGTFRKLTDNEKVTANLIMFSDVLPE